MSRKVIIFVFFLLVCCSVIGSGAAIFMPDIRQENPQIVLYTVHRGAKQTLPAAIRKLRDIAKDKGIKTEKGITLVALNNPLQQPGDHILTEIRIPVNSDALKYTGKLGEMTDVKRLPGCSVAVLEKRVGISDVFPYYENLYEYIRERERIPIYGPQETFSKDYDPNNYEKLKSEIKVVLWDGGLLPTGE